MYVNRVLQALNQVDEDATECLIQRPIGGASTQQAVFLTSNGGSGTTVSPVAVDLAVGSQRRRAPLGTDDPCDGSGALITIANNLLSSEAIFLGQFELLGQPDDVLIASSASGNSRDIRRCIPWALEGRMQITCNTEFVGGAIKELGEIDILACVKDFSVSEDTHAVAKHTVTESSPE